MTVTGDLPVSAFNQILSRHLPSCKVVGIDAVTGQFIVHPDRWDLLTLQIGLQTPPVSMRVEEEDAVHGPVAQYLGQGLTLGERLLIHLSAQKKKIALLQELVEPIPKALGDL